MTQRVENRKKTSEDLAKIIRDEEGITLEEARKKVLPTEWKHEQKVLWGMEGMLPTRAYIKSKPYEILQNPTKDKHRWLGAQGYILVGAGLPRLAIPIRTPREEIQKIINDNKIHVVSEPSFNDSDKPLESGKQKYEEVKALKEKWGEVKSPTTGRVFPSTGHWYYDNRLRDRWLIVPNRRLELWRDDLLTKDWNSLPEGCPFYEIGSVEFFELFNDFNPILMSMCDMRGVHEGSLIASQMELERAFDWFHPTPRMKELITYFKRWIDEGDCPSDYENDFRRTKREVRKKCGSP